MNLFYQSQVRVVATVFLSLLLVVPFTVGAERSDTAGIEVRASEGSAATTEVCEAGEDCDDTHAEVKPAATMQDLDEDYNTPRSNRSVAGPEGTPNVCDGVTCPDGSCAATDEMCGDAATAADSVCNGYLCDSGECVSDELWCGVDFDFEVDTATVADSVCNGYLCNDGTCASSEAMCGINFEDLPAAVAKCPADSPIRCGDGSCSAEVDRCLAIEGQIDSPSRSAGANPEAGDGGLSDGARPEIVDNERVRNNNSARPDNATAVTPNDTDSDSDGDGLDDSTEGVQNHNSSRSNRHNLREVFSDTDTDGRPEVMFRNGAFIPVDETAAGNANTSGGGVVCWGRAADEEGKVYSWGRGICMAGEATVNATTTAQERLSALQVHGDDVRGWNQEQQAAWQEFLETRATTSAEEQMFERMVEKTRENERIQEITSDEDGVGMQYRAEMRLFGLIPLEREVAAEVTAEGEVEVDYPWYRFLSRVPEKATIRNILSDLQTVHGGGAGKVSL